MVSGDPVSSGGLAAVGRSFACRGAEIVDAELQVANLFPM
jgi:hypothetical protein